MTDHGMMTKLAMEMNQRDIVTGDMIFAFWMNNDLASIDATFVNAEFRVEFNHNAYEIMKFVGMDENGYVFTSTRDKDFNIGVPMGYNKVREYETNLPDDPWLVIVVDGHINEYKPKPKNSGGNQYSHHKKNKRH